MTRKERAEAVRAAGYRVEYVPRPAEMLGMPGDHRWAVYRLKDDVPIFIDAFRTRREAEGNILNSC
jgi:hypothetical protein